MSDLYLSPQVFSILTTLITERVGISYGITDKLLFDSKVTQRAQEAGFSSMLDYYYFLRYDDADQREFRALAESLTVHETYFFRELEPLRIGISQFVAPAVEQRGFARVWCAACATGEEAYMLAMLLDDAGILGSVELVASDLSERALARARSGEFSSRALRQRSEHPFATRYLETTADGLRAAPALRSRIDFRNVNLAHLDSIRALGDFDLIACRNVLFYFADRTARATVEQLGEQLHPTGALLVGVTESLMRFGTALTCEERGGAFFYRKEPRS